MTYLTTSRPYLVNPQKRRVLFSGDIIGPLPRGIQGLGSVIAWNDMSDDEDHLHTSYKDSTGVNWRFQTARDSGGPIYRAVAEDRSGRVIGPLESIMAVQRAIVGQAPNGQPSSEAASRPPAQPAEGAWVAMPDAATYRGWALQTSTRAGSRVYRAVKNGRITDMTGDPGDLRAQIDLIDPPATTQAATQATSPATSSATAPSAAPAVTQETLIDMTSTEPAGQSNGRSIPDQARYEEPLITLGPQQTPEGPAYHPSERAMQEEIFTSEKMILVGTLAAGTLVALWALLRKKR